MPPPSQLAIATSVVTRLLKEEASYHKELADQEAQVKKLEESISNGGGDEDGNAEFMLKQNKTAAEQTKAVFGPLKERIAAALTKLEVEIISAKEEGGSADLDNAESVLEKAKAKAE